MSPGLPATPGQKIPHGPLPGLLLALTMITGVVDAISYLKLGHVFVANMTGNIAFLGFAVADAKEFSIAASLTATIAFLTGALAGGRLGTVLGSHRGHLLVFSIFIETAIIGAALCAWILSDDSDGETMRYLLIVVLALAMGLQNATALRIGVPDLTTTVLTQTLTGLAADSKLVGGNNPRPVRRLAATFTMFLGAGMGTFVIFHFSLGAVLALVLMLLLGSGIAALRYFSSSDPWTEGA